jgi:hypothetical protein
MEGTSSSGGLEIGISCFTGPHLGTGGQKHTHDVEGSGLISMEITGVKIFNKNRRNFISIQAGGTCHALGVGEAMRDKQIIGLVRQRVFDGVAGGGGRKRQN